MQTQTSSMKMTAQQLQTYVNDLRTRKHTDNYLLWHGLTDMHHGQRASLLTMCISSI